MKMRRKIKILIVLLMLVSLAIPFGLGKAVVLKSTFPRLSNYFLSWDLSEEQARELAKWDLVVLDMEHQVKNPDKIRLMRQLNPNIIILAYLTTQEIFVNTPSFGNLTPLRQELWQNIQPAWWLKRPDGQKASWWQGTLILNMTDQAPAVNGMSWGDYLARFTTNRILSSDLWDGVFFDNTWNSLIGKVNANLDIDGDGATESRTEIDQSYLRGMNDFFGQVRGLSGNRYLLMGNDGNVFESLNGMQFENFPWARGWSRMMRDYSSFPADAASPAFSALNANTANAGGADDYQRMRFGMASALLSDGFYSFDLGDQNHGQTWWYDEYGFSLGEPASAAFLAKNNSRDFNQTGLWRRDFKGGLVLANSGNTPQSIDLNGEYEKIKGEQDPAINDGLIVSTVTIAPQDGLILLRPIDELVGAPFRNGSFARVFNQTGQTIRNGFFSYQSQFKGGDTLLIDDLDADGTKEIVVLKSGLISFYKDEILWREFRPFGKSFKGELSLAAADVNADGQKELLVGQRSQGGAIKIFDLSGQQMGKTISAFGQSYRGGVNLAIGDLNGNGNLELVIGQASNYSQIKIFSTEGRLLSGGFYAYGRSFRGGVNLAVGDVDGNGQAEIITGPTTGKPEIRIFNHQAKQVGQAFLGASAKGKNGVAVAAVDIDADGRAEIVGLSSEVFTTAMK